MADDDAHDDGKTGDGNGGGDSSYYTQLVSNPCSTPPTQL
jgi:hypothetical protein